MSKIARFYAIDLPHDNIGERGRDRDPILVVDQSKWPSVGYQGQGLHRGSGDDSGIIVGCWKICLYEICMWWPWLTEKLAASLLFPNGFLPRQGPLGTYLSRPWLREMCFSAAPTERIHHLDRVLWLHFLAGSFEPTPCWDWGFWSKCIIPLKQHERAGHGAGIRQNCLSLLSSYDLRAFVLRLRLPTRLVCRSKQGFDREGPSTRARATGAHWTRTKVDRPMKQPGLGCWMYLCREIFKSLGSVVEGSRGTGQTSWWLFTSASLLLWHGLSEHKMHCLENQEVGYVLSGYPSLSLPTICRCDQTLKPLWNKQTNLPGGNWSTFSDFLMGPLPIFVSSTLEFSCRKVEFKSPTDLCSWSTIHLWHNTPADSEG